MKNLYVSIVWPLLLGSLLGGTSSALAQSQYYWDASSPIDASPGSGGSGNWNPTITNWWVGGSSDSVWANGNIANFAGTAGTATITSAVTVNGITFVTSGYTVGGSSNLTLAGTPVITVPSLGTDTMSCPIAGTVPVTVSGSGVLVLSHANTSLTGGVTINSGAALALTTVSGAGTGTIADNGTLSVTTGAASFSAPITGGPSSIVDLNIPYTTGSENIRFTGSSLSGYNGTVNLIAGLSGGQPGAGQIIVTNTFSSSMTWNIGAGATLDFPSTPGVTFPSSVIINGRGNSQPYGALRLDSVNQMGNVLLNGSGITIGDDAAGGAAPSQISGVISDNNQGFGFTKVAPRSITLSGANTYTGPTILSAGTLQLGSAETPGSSGPLGNSPASNPGSVVMSGGTLQYSTANNSDYSGRFSTVSDQAYNIDENGEIVTFASPLVSSAGSLTLADTLGGGSLTLTGNNTYSGATTVTTGYLIVSGSIASSVITLTTVVSGLELDNPNALPGGAVLALPSSPDYPVNLNFTGTQNITTLIIASTIMPSGTYGAPGNTNVLYQNSAFSGNGIINVQPATYWDGNGSDALNQTNIDGGGSGKWDNNTADWWQSGSSDMKWSSNNVATFAGTAGTVTLDGNIIADGLTFTTSGYDITNTDGVSTLTLAGTPMITVLSGTAEIDCILAGTAGLTESGSGTLTLAGSNTYMGPTSIAGGCSLVLSRANAYTGATTIGNGGSLTIGPFGDLAGGSYAGNIANSGGIIYGSFVSQSLSGIISGGGTLTQEGPGSLTLSGLNTFTGAIAIDDGTLSITGSGDLGNNVTFNTGLFANSINNSGSFIYGSSAAQTLSGGISGSGTLTQSGSGALTLTGDNTYTGATAITSGTLTLSGSGAISNSTSISIAAGAIFDVSGVTGSFALSASTSLSATGPAAVMKGPSSGGINLGAQPITLTFTPPTFTGDTTHQALNISQGALTLDDNVISVVNASASPLGAGTYTLIKVAGGIITNAPAATLGSVGGAGLAANTTASLAVSGGSLNLVVASPVVPAPVINNFSLSGGNLILSGTNGPDNGTYYVLTSTNAALPLADWTSIATNTFGATGTFAVTNAVGAGQSFFVIEIAP